MFKISVYDRTSAYIASDGCLYGPCSDVRKTASKMIADAHDLIGAVYFEAGDAKERVIILFEKTTRKPERWWRLISWDISGALMQQDAGVAQQMQLSLIKELIDNGRGRAPEGAGFLIVEGVGRRDEMAPGLGFEPKFAD
jgi:hypothetical protein